MVSTVRLGEPKFTRDPLSEQRGDGDRCKKHDWVMGRYSVPEELLPSTDTKH